VEARQKAFVDRNLHSEAQETVLIEIKDAPNLHNAASLARLLLCSDRQESLSLSGN